MSPRNVTSVLLSGPNGPPTFLGVRVGRPSAVVALLVIAFTVGCSGTPESATSTKPGSTAATATDPSNATSSTSANVATTAPGTTVPGSGFSAEQQTVIAAHDRGMKAYASAATASNPQDPALKSAFAPEFLRQVQIRIDQRTQNGQAVRDAQPSQSRTVYLAVTVSGGTASMTTCEVDDRVVYRIADGSVVNAKVTTGRWSVSMTDDGSGWKIGGRTEVQTWGGEELDSCVASSQSA